MKAAFILSFAALTGWLVSQQFYGTATFFALWCIWEST